MSHTAQQDFDAVVAHVAPWLKARGFVKQGHRFGVRRGSDWHVIDLQKHSLATTRDKVLFTIEVGAWFRDFEDESRNRPPAISACHWSKRVGDEPPEQDERWWIIDRETQVDRLTSLLIDAFERALQVLEYDVDQPRVIDLFLKGKKAHLRIGRSYRDRIERLASG